MSRRKSRKAREIPVLEVPVGEGPPRIEGISGVAEDLTEDGHLALRMPDGEVGVCASANLVRVEE